MVELSIVIITLNEEYWLPTVLDSLKYQTYQNFEVIVSDAESEDKTREIARSYGHKVVRGGNYTVGRNNGAKVSRGKYILFLDADCYLPENFLEVNMSIIKSTKKKFGTTNALPISDKYFDYFFFQSYNIFQKSMSRISPHCVGASIFIERKHFWKLGGFDERVVFAENHTLSKKCKGSYIILPIPILTSVRRMDKDGRLKFLGKYLYSGAYRLFNKEIEEELFEYNNERKCL